MKFEKDFAKFLNQHKKLKKEKNKFNNDCMNFLKKYNLLDIFVEKFGGIDILLNDNFNIDLLKTLLDNINNDEVLEIIIDKIKVNKENELLNQNIFNNFIRDKFEEAERFNYEKFNENTLILPGKHGTDYLFDYNTINALKYSFNRDNKVYKDFFYVVVFNQIIKNNEKILVYNYIKYNALLIKLFYVFIIIEQYRITSDIRRGYLRSDFIYNVDIGILEKYESLLQYYFDFEKIGKEYYESYTEQKKKCANPIQILKLSIIGQLIKFNNEKFTNLIKILKSWNINSNNDVEIFNILKVLMNTNNVDDITKFYSENKDSFYFDNMYNLLSRFIFIVPDIDQFIGYIKNNIDKDINQGDKRVRGKFSRLNHILNNIDQNFRNSMYNHTVKFSLDSPEQYKSFSKATFSYENIHINLGSEN